MGDDPAPAAAETVRQRLALERLFEPVDRLEAADWADRLIDEFGSIGALMGRSPEAWARVAGAQAAACLEAVAEVTGLWLRAEAFDAPVLGNSESLMNYLRVTQARDPSERIRVLFLNALNRLLRDEMLAFGTVDEVPLWPREILRRALEVNAASVILVHNHPSGDPTPSRVDLDMTRRFRTAARELGVVLLDHLIVSPGGSFSFRDAKLL